jgi:hypothetical protein
MLSKYHTAPLILALFLPAGSGLCASAQDNKCSIEGFVREAGTGMPLPGAEVTIFAGAGNEPVIIVTDEADGHYAAADLQPGTYSVMVHHTGYITQTYGQRKRNRKGVSLILESGRKLEDIDFNLVRSGVITGRVLGQNNGPLVGTAIEALSFGYTRGHRHLLAGGLEKTNDLGEYRIYGLAPGRYYLVALGEEPEPAVRRSPGFREPEVYVSTFYPNVDRLEDARAIDVLPGGETRGIDVAAIKKSTFHVRGRIQAFDSTAQYARVQIKPTDLGGDQITSGADIAPDAQGNFDFRKMVPGSYVITTTFTQKGNFKSAWRYIQVGDADVNDVNLVTSPGLDLRGRIQVEGDKKADFSRVRVELYDPYSPFDLSAVVSSDGSFLLRGAEHHAYEFGMSDLPEDFYLKSVRLGDRELLDTTLDLSGAIGVPGVLDVRISGAGGRVEGVVRNDNGTPMSDVTVVLVPDSDRRKEAILFKNTTADQNGRFAIQGITPGEYKLFAWGDVEEGAWQDPEFLRLYEAKGEDIKIEPNGHLAQDLTSISVAAE